MCGIRYFAVLLFLLSFNVFSTYGYRSFFPKRKIIIAFYKEMWHTGIYMEMVLLFLPAPASCAAPETDAMLRREPY